MGTNISLPNNTEQCLEEEAEVELTPEEEEEFLKELDDPDYMKVISEKEFFSQLYTVMKEHNEKLENEGLSKVCNPIEDHGSVC